MPAPTANKNAERWTLEKTLDALLILDSCSFNDECLYLGQALSMTGFYADLWSYWRRKWKSNYQVTHLMKTILQRFESRIFSKMSNKDIPAQVGMFVLKHHYGWGRDPLTEPAPDMSYIFDDQPPFEHRGPSSRQERELQTEAPSQHELPSEIDIASDMPTRQEYKEAAPAGNSLHPKPVHPKEFQQKLSAYNKANPLRPVSRPACYFMGDPPQGMPAISFDGGYFLTLSLQ